MPTETDPRPRSIPNAAGGRAADPPLWDVFLSHSPRDAGVVRLVAGACERAGLAPYLEDVRLDGRLPDAVREAVAECAAGLLLATPASVATSNLAFEAGLLMGWSKPIWVIHDGLPFGELPEFLTQFRVRPLTELDETVADLKASADALTDPQREVLIEAYREAGVTTDRLLTRPAAVDRLAEAFARKSRRTAAGHTLIRELVHLRKLGRLPRLDRPTAQAG